MQLSGKCLCGNVQVQLSDLTEIPQSAICHCDNCRITTSCCSNNLPVPKSSVSVTSGTPKVYEDKASSSGKAVLRHFCGDCGTPLWSQPTVEAMASIAFVKVGMLDKSQDIAAGSMLFPEKAQKNVMNLKDLAA